MSDTAYTLIHDPRLEPVATANEFRTLLEKGSDEAKIDAMKRILVAVLAGNPMPDLLMHVIRFVMPSKNKTLKKLLYFYWEVCPKLDDQGKMRHEMILVCNAIQRDLLHPNEFIRGNTLRYLTKLKEPELLETLIPNVRQCLEHRHAYVRKHAVFALYSIYRVAEHLCPDADELLFRFLAEESDSVCKRNAFVCLGALNRQAAVQYLQECIPVIDSLDPLLQLGFIEFVKKDATENSQLRAQYALLVADIIESSSNAVVYEAANALAQLLTSLLHILLAASKLVDLATREPDSNVKIITLDRIAILHEQFPGVLQDLSLDVLRILLTPDVDVRKKALLVTLKFVTSRNVEDVVKLLKKELQASAASDEEKSSEYRHLLINSIRQLAIRFVEVAANVIDLLLDSVADLNTVAAAEVVSFVKDVVEKYPDLRTSLISRLVAALPSVRSGKVLRGALWIIGEYAVDEKLTQEAWRCIRASVGDLPIAAPAPDSTVEEEAALAPHKSGPVVLPDGTYATENAMTSEPTQTVSDPLDHPIRTLILAGDFYLGAILASTLVKLLLRLNRLKTAESIVNALKAEALLIMVSILRAGELKAVSKPIDEDSAERIFACIKVATDDSVSEEVELAFLDDTKAAFESQVRESDEKAAAEAARTLHKNAEQVDDAIVFSQLVSDGAKTVANTNDDLAVIAESPKKKDALSSRLQRITQLTGFSDPIYAEAFINVHQYDVVMDVLLVNQTTNTLRNLSIEFATLGDLKVVDKPAPANLGPHGFLKVQCTIKVSSADTGVIFGNIVYDGQHSDESSIVILNDVHVDIMDYIKPATCSESQFRKMWNAFEWENKITITSQLPSLKDYLEALMRGTNMACLTPGAAAGEECNFLSANLYSRSTFGEDALANLSIERENDGPIVGHIRIRSKGQGLAMLMGDRVATISRSLKKAAIEKV